MPQIAASVVLGLLGWSASQEADCLFRLFGKRRQAELNDWEVLHWRRRLEGTVSAVMGVESG